MVGHSIPNPHVVYVETGVPGLDHILGGGLIEAGLYLIQGDAGTGKTILSSQIAFHLARQRKRVVIATLIAESHGKLLQHLSTLRFFDHTVLAEHGTLFSLYQGLTDHGLPGLLQLTAQTLHEQRPALLVVDGFSTIHDFTQERSSLAQFMHELNALTATTRCTTILLAHRCATADLSVEEMLVDGVLELGVFPIGMRRAREIEVRKMRASSPLSGTHAVKISEDGVTVFPRLESVVKRERVTPGEIDIRLPFGIANFDTILGGGLPAGSATSLLGATGSGKTLLGMHFLRTAVARGEHCIYFGFFEPPDRLLAKSAAIGLDFHDAVRSGQLQIVWQPPFELRVDELAHQLLTIVRERRISRLFVDGIEGFLDGAVHRERISTFLTALSVSLRESGATTLFSEELPLFTETIETGTTLLSAVVENVLLLRYVEIDAELRRLISVIKLRESSFDPSIREFSISRHGISVFSKLESDERPQGARSGKAGIRRDHRRDSPARADKGREGDKE